MDTVNYPERAKQIVRGAIEGGVFGPEADVLFPSTRPEDFYVVWFAKVLQNWKALVSTDLVPGQYFEVTYNGDREESYVDWYQKSGNEAIADSFFGFTNPNNG